MPKVIIVIVLITLISGVGKTQELSLDLYPSEDEIYEALLMGEISYQQYLVLKEIIYTGIDSTSIHLLDQIPNLSFFQFSDRLKNRREMEQQSAFVKNDSKQAVMPFKIEGVLKHRYERKLEENSSSKYISTVKLKAAKVLTADLKIAREYSGRERVVSRSLLYKNKDRLFREIVIGNYSRRFGLGTVFGYRGKIFDFTASIEEESFLFPDYGGCNGFYGRMKHKIIDIEYLFSLNRDVEHSLVSNGMKTSINMGVIKPGLIYGFNILKNRKTDHSTTISNWAISNDYYYKNGYNSIELSLQHNPFGDAKVFVSEGKHRLNMAELKYAFWYYDDNYLDLTSGAKTGSLSRKIYLPETDFEYNDRHNGQTGGMFKTLVALYDRLNLSNGFILSRINNDSTDIQWLAELHHEISDDVDFSLNYLQKLKNRNTSDEKVEDLKKQVRMEVKINNEKLYLKSYLSYNYRTENSDFWAFWISFKTGSFRTGKIEIWSNLSRIYPGKGMIDYWYGYIKNSIYLLEKMTVSFKLNHTYRRQAFDKNISQVSLELNYLL